MFSNIFIKKTNRYKALLLALIGFIFISPMLPEGLVSEILVAGLFFMVICLASFSLITHPVARWILPFFGVSALIFGALVHYDVIFAILNRVMMFLFFCTTIKLFSHDIFNEPNPKVDHLYGAIIIYFLIGITYTNAFLFLQLIDKNQFIFGNTRLPVTDSFDLYYFSFITLNTVGYGDIIANGHFAKVMCMLESITGLFYFAILVSSLLKVFQSTRK